MSLQKILPIARKMGEENFLAYKQYIKAVKAGKDANLTMNLKNTTIIDTLSFTVRDGQKADIDGFRNLLREIHKKYFPRAGSSETTKIVKLEHHILDSDNKTTLLKTNTTDNNGVIGSAEYSFTKLGQKLIANGYSFCEDFSINFFGIFKLKNNDMKNIQNATIKLPKSSKIEDCGDKVKLTLEALATPEVPALEANAFISKEKFESIFGGELEQMLPDMIEKSGMKFL
ncbi:MAG: hypothetical protein E7Z92_02895 [Cyanobacteria bacterium SIG31]|nr:hypothetical protein [Cyanobacteria bacterium SIG31]